MDQWPVHGQNLGLQRAFFFFSVSGLGFRGLGASGLGWFRVWLFRDGIFSPGAISQISKGFRV